MLVVGLLALAIAVPVSGGLLGFGASPSTGPAASEGAIAPSAAAPTATSASSEAPSQTDPPDTPEPTPVFADVAIVPVAHFRSTRASTDREEVEAVLAGRSTRYQALELVERDADAILAALDMRRPAEPRHLILAKDAKTLELTFRGSELVQAKMRPHIILDKAQPNFLDERGDGKIVMGQVYEASKGIVPW